MRFESCRACGTELQAIERCDICNESDLFRCPNCGTVTCKHIHQQALT